MSDFENKIKLIADVQKLAPDDKLTEIIHENSDCELSEDELDYVAAAAKQDYTRFLKYMHKSKNS